MHIDAFPEPAGSLQSLPDWQLLPAKEEDNDRKNLHPEGLKPKPAGAPQCNFSIISPVVRKSSPNEDPEQQS